jgi:transmembrane sensor
MSAGEPRNEPNASIFAEAGEWLVDFREGDVDAEGRRRFNAWLRRSPEHIQAYMEVAAVWGDIPRLAAGMEVDVDAVVAHARALNNVAVLNAPGLASLPAQPTSRPPVRAADAGKCANLNIASVRSPGKRGSMPRLWAYAAAVMALVAVSTLVTWLWTDRGSLYATAIGEQRSIALADGSAIELSARSAIRVRLSDRGRDVELLEGQALFSVAKDPSRPFVVTSSNARVRAVGTQFDVHRRSSGTTVTVLEGRVGVESQEESARAERRALYVSAGQQVTVPESRDSMSHETAGTRAPRLRKIDAGARDSWAERKLMFENAPLSDVVEEFNRYNETQMVLVGGSTLGTFRISGVFSATKPASLLRFLSDQMRLEVIATDHEISIAPKSAAETIPR